VGHIAKELLPLETYPTNTGMCKFKPITWMFAAQCLNNGTIKNNTILFYVK